MDMHMTDASSLAAGFAMAAPPAGAGVVTASVIMTAAGLCESLARTGGSPDARGLAVQAMHLRARADAASSANARAYTTARERLRPSAQTKETGRDAMLRAALVQAADTLLSIAGVAADCAALAATLAETVAPDLRPDAVAAAELAAGATAGVAVLVEANLALPADDVRRELAASLIAMAHDSCATARRSLTG